MDSMYSIIFGILEDDSDVEQILPHSGAHSSQRLICRGKRMDFETKTKPPLTERLDKIK